MKGTRTAPRHKRTQPQTKTVAIRRTGNSRSRISSKKKSIPARKRRTAARSRKPRRLLFSTKRWVGSKPSTLSNGNAYQEFGPAEVVSYPEGKGIGMPVPGSFQSGTEPSPPAFTAVIKHARIWGPSGAVITPDGTVLCDVSWEYRWRFLARQRHSILRTWKPYPLKKIEGTVGHLAHVSSSNYFHWLFDVLPRIDLIRKSGQRVDRYLFRSMERTGYQDEILNAMGIPAEQRIYATPRFHAEAETLVMPSLVSRYKWKVYAQPVTYSKRATEFVRRELMTKLRPSQPAGERKRLYISRANAGHRRLLNEPMITAMLVSQGFTVIHPENMTVKEQIHTFASAEAVVAPHGAGLANLAFCSPGTKVIEMFSPAYTPGYYWMLSSHFGLDYRYLIGETIGKVRPWRGGMDMIVDPGRLNLLLKMAGIGD